MTGPAGSQPPEPDPDMNTVRSTGHQTDWDPARPKTPKVELRDGIAHAVGRSQGSMIVMSGRDLAVKTLGGLRTAGLGTVSSGRPLASV